MAINLNDNIYVSGGKPSEPKSYRSDGTPYASISEANSTIPLAYRYRGLTVMILLSGVLTEYWYKDGTADVNLIVKSSSGSSFSFENGLTETAGVVKLGGTLTGNTLINTGAYSFNLSMSDGGLYVGPFGDFGGTYLTRDNGAGFKIGGTFLGTGNVKINNMGESVVLTLKSDGLYFQNFAAPLRLNSNSLTAPRFQTFKDGDGVIQLEGYLGTKALSSTAITPTLTENGKILSWNNTSGLYELSNINASNGLTVNANNNIKLGGTLTEFTLLSGDGTQSLMLYDVPFTKLGKGNLYLESATVSEYGRIRAINSAIDLISFNTVGSSIFSVSGKDITLNSATGSKIFGINATQLYVTDTSGKGIEYSANYHATYTNRSLVDKQYVDSVSGTSLNGTGFVRMSGTTPSYITGTTSQFVKADGSLDSNTYALNGYLGTKSLNTLTPTGVENGFSLVFDSTLDKYKLKKVNDYLEPTVDNSSGSVAITISDKGKTFLPTNTTTFTLPLWSSVTAPFIIDFVFENQVIVINPNAGDLGIIYIDDMINFNFSGGYGSLRLAKLTGSNRWRII